MKLFGSLITVLSFSVLYFFYGTFSVLAPILLLYFSFYMAVLLCLIYDFPGVVHLK